MSSDEGAMFHRDDVDRIIRAVRRVEDSVSLPPAPRRRVLAESNDSETSCCQPRWDLWIQATGVNYESGSFELEVTFKPDDEEEEETETIDVDWNETASSLRTKLTDLHDDIDVTVVGGSLDRRSIVIGPGQGEVIKDLQIGVNDLTSGRPYLTYKYKTEDLEPHD